MSGRAFSPAQLAERLGLSVHTIRTMIRRGDIQTFRVGHLHRVRADIVRALVAKRKGAVYFLATQPPRGKKVKIGWTTNIRKRIDTLRTGSPVKLDLVFHFRGTPEDERALHKRFAEHRMEGEWFWWCKPIEDYINERLDQEDADAPRNEWDRT